MGFAFSMLANRFSKRAFDMVICTFLLILLLPVIVVLSLTILLIDGRPVFFVQQRIGLAGRLFPLIKFRTMHQPNSDRADVGVTGGDKNRRITSLGKLLREAHLDELPQLINVLRGQMSLVGPRPTIPRYVEVFPKLQRSYLMTRPGITGLATALFLTNERRILWASDSADETERLYTTRCVPKKTRLDAFYVANWSFWLDIKIFYWTLALHLPLPGRRARRARLDHHASSVKPVTPATRYSPKVAPGCSDRKIA